MTQAVIKITATVRKILMSVLGIVVLDLPPMVSVGPVHHAPVIDTIFPCYDFRIVTHALHVLTPVIPVLIQYILF